MEIFHCDLKTQNHVPHRNVDRMRILTFSDERKTLFIDFMHHDADKFTELHYFEVCLSKQQEPFSCVINFHFDKHLRCFHHWHFLGHLPAVSCHFSRFRCWRCNLLHLSHDTVEVALIPVFQQLYLHGRFHISAPVSVWERSVYELDPVTLHSFHRSSNHLIPDRCLTELNDSVLACRWVLMMTLLTCSLMTVSSLFRHAWQKAWPQCSRLGNRVAKS